MAGPNGVHVGPLDPNKAENFGQVGGKGASTSARQLVRHHLAMYPPDLARALASARNEARSGDAIDREEAKAVVARALEDSGIAGAAVSGLSVRGEDDAEQWLAYTWQYPVDAAKADAGVTGRSSKGAIPYDRELLPKTVALGDEAAKIAKAQKSGVPYLPTQLVDALTAALSGSGGGGSNGSSESELNAAKKAADDAAAERDTLQQEKDDLAARVEALERQIKGIAGTTPPVSELGGSPSGEPEGEAPTAPDFTGPPWEGYDDANADVIAKRLKEGPEGEEPALAEHVAVYERANAHRATVIQAADRILDRTPSS